MMYRTNIRAAFVSTNSITQGEQVSTVWKPLYKRFNIHIDFAYQTFKWDSEAKDKAAVHCVIIGFSCIHRENCTIYSENGRVKDADNISPYLINSPNIWIESRTKPIDNVSIMQKGSQPTDGGYLILSPDERNELIKEDSSSEKYIKQYTGAREFINHTKRYCLWLQDIQPNEIRKHPSILKRIKLVQEERAKSKKEATRKMALYPHLFTENRQPQSNYLLVPSVSSENRRYIPIGYMSPDVVASNLVFTIPNATLYEFGILTSNVHMAWMRSVAGRLEMRYRYSNNIVYNNFPWPSPTKEQKDMIEKAAQEILNARTLYPDSSFADLYDETTMPIELRKAHQANDKAVMEAYGFNWRKMSESDCVAELMKMYEEKTKYH